MKATYLSLMGSLEAQKLIQALGEQERRDKAEKLRKKLLAQQAKQNAKALEKEHKYKKLVKVYR